MDAELTSAAVSGPTGPIDLTEVASTGKCAVPKGLVPYRPRSAARLGIKRDVLEVFDRLEAADALPVGPRQVGYRLKEFRGYGKADFKEINRVITRLQQSGELPWAWVSDAASITSEPSGWSSPADFLDRFELSYVRDRRIGQATVIEVFAEAKETLPLIKRLAHERGVGIYSGSGSSGPGLARKVAIRALTRAVDHGQSTLLLGIGDFDKPGIDYVMRPHLEHLAAFLYGTDPLNDKVISYRGQQMSEVEATVTFQHIALTPEQALEHTDSSDIPGRAAVFDYIESGECLWTRDLELLKEAPKVEVEALDPVELRDLVVASLDNVLDQNALEAGAAAEAAERETLASLFTGGLA